MTLSLNPREGMKANQVKEEITMTAMETLMIILMSCLALLHSCPGAWIRSACCTSRNLTR